MAGFNSTIEKYKWNTDDTLDVSAEKLIEGHKIAKAAGDAEAMRKLGGDAYMLLNYELVSDPGSLAQQLNHVASDNPEITAMLMGMVHSMSTHRPVREIDEWVRVEWEELKRAVDAKLAEWSKPEAFEKLRDKLESTMAEAGKDFATEDKVVIRRHLQSALDAVGGAS